MDAATLREAMGASLSIDRYRQLAPAFDAAMAQAGCTTINRAAMWCAQLGHESLGLRYMQEIASGAAYEGRKDLGNTQPDDGRRFKGHGPIQITGRHNHTEVSKWAHAKGYVPSPTYFVDKPAELASDRYGFLGPVWYWTVARPDINALCDKGDLITVTRRINGGTNGLADRRARWERCLRLGSALLPTGAAPAANVGTHTVRSGDTLSGIAARYPGVTWQAIAAANQLTDPDRLRLGQVLRIPAPPATPVLEEDDMPSVADVWAQPIEDLYTAQPGDGMPAFAALGWATAHAAHARNAATAALSEIAGLRVAVDRLAAAVGDGQGIDPGVLQQAVRDGVAQALAESVQVSGELHVAPRP